MAQQNEGWPLGLQPLNARIGVVRNRDNSGSVSFNTLITGSPSSSTDSSSDLDTQSTGSFFPDKSTTLGSLIGVSSILELSRRSLRGVKAEVLKRKKGHKSNWKSCFLCMWFEVEGEKNKKNENGEDNDVAASSSLGHFLAVERKAASENRRNQSLIVSSVYDDDEDHEFMLAQTQRVMCDEPNSLFVNGCIAPPQGCITTSSSL